MRTYAARSNSFWNSLSLFEQSQSADTQSLSSKNSTLESNTLREKPLSSGKSWGTITGNIRKTLSANESKSRQGSVLQQKADKTTPQKTLISDMTHQSFNVKEQIQRKVDGKERNKTGLPERLKAGVEHLSGLSMDDVKVRYNSTKPSQIQALAYTQGTNIHLGPGQEKHLPHELWHVAQQKQGRVNATTQAKGIAINNDTGLEHEADVMGTKALNIGHSDHAFTESATTSNRSRLVQQKATKSLESHASSPAVVQRVLDGQAAVQAFQTVIDKADEWGHRWSAPQPQDFTQDKINDYAAATAQDFQALATMGRRLIEEKDDVFAGWRVSESAVEDIFKKFYKSMIRTPQRWKRHLMLVYKRLTVGQVLKEFNHRGAYLALRYLAAQCGLTPPGSELIGFHVNRGLPSKQKQLLKDATAIAYPG